MGNFLKHHAYKFVPALFLLFAFSVLSGTSPKDSAFCADCELVILWNDTLSEEDAAGRLSLLCGDLSLTDHFDTVSICESTDPESFSEQLALLNSQADIRIAEPNFKTELFGLMGNVKYGDAQWAFHNMGDYIYYINDIPIHRSATPDVDINLPEAYKHLESQSPLRPVTVAIIDTGVDISHPALSSHIRMNPGEIPDNGLDDDNNGYIDDVNGWDFYNNDNTVCHYRTSEYGLLGADPSDNDNHGTHCAGIIASSEGVFGVASGIDIRILPLKIHGGERNTGSVGDAIKAIKYAQAAGADICNMSWGTSVYSEALETVMRESDMLFVVAAGNSGNNNNSSPLYPASYLLDNMISVAYITQSGELASDSNYGLSTVDIAAPGQDIFSTTVGGEYHYLSGTSMAAPVVSGISALLYAYGEAPYPQNIKEILLQTLKPVEALTGYVRYPGIPDAAQVMAATDSMVNDTLPPTLDPKTQYNESELIVSLSPEDLGGSGIRTVRYASGLLETSYFCHGTLGQSITDGTLSLAKAGTYTFYISDYAGNETSYAFTVKDDTAPPSLSASYKENPDGTFTVTVTASDKESGIKRLRFLEGMCEEHHFLADGIDLTPETGYSFLATEGSSFTLFAADERGNKTTETIFVSRISAEQLFINTSERTLQVGDSFRLVPLILPFNTTDYVSYAVNDETLLFVSADGTLTPLAPGIAEVTVSTSSGVQKACILHILEAEPAPEVTPVPVPLPTPEPAQNEGLEQTPDPTSDLLPEITPEP